MIRTFFYSWHRFFLSLIAGLALTACSQATSENTTEQIPHANNTDVIEQVVENYIRNHPDVILESLERFAVQKVQEQRKKSTGELLSPNDAAQAGAALDDATLVIVEFFDYHCGYCKRATPKIAQLIEDTPKITVLFRELPILRQESTQAARLALAAREQGRYADLHFAMMDASGVLTEDKILKIATSLGLNPVQLKKDATNPNITATIERTKNLAMQLEISGTPAFVVLRQDGSYMEVISGWSPEMLDQKIEEAFAHR